MARKKLGLLQTRGLGDIVIALPIAKHYHDAGYHVHWPILDTWLNQFEEYVPWVKWIPIPQDHGPFFYDVPLARLKNLKCDEIIPLYQALSGHVEFTQEPHFQHVKFDQCKYLRANVPFLNKWKLNECITRNLNKEQELKQKVLADTSNYVVAHLEGSSAKTTFDTSIIPSDWQIVEIRPIDGFSIWDWITVIDEAQSIICIDSVYANIVDQLGLGTDRYFIPRSHIQLTPVQGQDWTWIDNPHIDKNTRIFR